MRERRPYLNEALEDEIGPAAEIALHRARRDPDDRGDPRKRQPEQDRKAKPIQQPGEDIAALIVGAEPVPFEIAAGAIRLFVHAQHGGAALRFAQHPSWRRGGGDRQLAVDRPVGIADRRPEHETVLVDFLGDHLVTIVGLRKKAAKFLFRIIVQDRKQKLALIDDQQRFVVGDELREKRQDKDEEKNPERPIAAFVGFEIRQTALVDRAEAQWTPSWGGVHERLWRDAALRQGSLHG